MIYRKRKKVDDVKKYVKTVNPDLPGQQIQKGYFKEAILEWKTGEYKRKDIEAWDLYARANRKKVSGFNMFAKFKINADVESKTWERLTNCIIYDVTGVGFKVDINVNSDYSGKLYIGTSKLSMLKEVTGVFSVDKYTFTIIGLLNLTKYYFYIKNTAIGKEGRTGIYSKKTTEYTPIVIDIGNPAIDGEAIFGSGYTIVDRINPANDSGKILSIEIYAAANIGNVDIGIFYVVEGNILSTRDNVLVTNIVAGYNQRDVDINVVAGDYIGMYFTAGYLDITLGTSNGYWYKKEDQIPCEGVLFTIQGNQKISLKGTGLTG